MKTAVLIASLLCALGAHAGHSEGNGGDHVRATFIKVGQAALKFLKETEAGQKIVAEHQLSLEALERTLDIKVISVEDKELRDNRGSVVDALGVPDAITLSKNAWAQHFEKERDVYYLVFHEMLRAAAVNDDNFVVSKGLDPFPISQRVATRITPVLPLIPSDSLASVLDTEGVVISGTGCPLAQRGTVLEFDAERNVLEVALRRYAASAQGEHILSRRACSIALPFKARAGQRLVVAMVDLGGKVDVSGSGLSQVRFEAFTAGGSQAPQERALGAGNNGRLLIRKQNVLRSECGQDSILRLNTSALSRLTGTGEGKAHVELDRIAVYLSTEGCRPLPLRTLTL